MTVLVNDPDFTLHLGDVLEVLAELPDESVHCVVTSPPYWGLRDYSTEGQFGLEPTPDLYVENMVRVFREVRRVLRRDGTCWLNIGDSYAGGGRARGKDRDAIYGESKQGTNAGTNFLDAAPVPEGLKSKDLCGIPWRLAFALQQDGWYLRSEIIWAKPNPMPESVTDRPTKSHEQVFLLTRSPRYFYDADAVRESYIAGNMRDGFRGENDGPSAYVNQIGPQNNSAKGPDGRTVTRVVGQDGSAQHRDGERWPNPAGRNLRSVWNIATEPYPDAHFATFPQALVEPCVKAGTSEHGCCPECGAPWERETSVDYDNPGNRTTNGPRSMEARDDPRHGTVNSRGSRLEKRVETTGWKPSCSCGDPNPRAGKDSKHRQSLPRGVCPDCGEWVTFRLDGRPRRHGCFKAGGDGNADGTDAGTPAERLHGTVVPAPAVPCTVLDPFMGSGTVALVARKLGRRSIGIELNPTYAQLCVQRTRQLSLLTGATS